METDTDYFASLASGTDLELSTVDKWGAEFDQPYDDAPTFEANENPEVDTSLRLNHDKRFTRTPTRRLFVDYRSNPDAYAHLKPLPKAGESIHCILSGKYALWELVPAFIESAGDIDELLIATLSYSRQNSQELVGLLDDGHISTVGIIISYFFKAQNRPLYDSLVPQLRERGMQVKSIRNHAKILLLKMKNGDKYVVESSANLRSSINLEFAVITNEPKLHEFHRQWMVEEILNGKELGK